MSTITSLTQGTLVTNGVFMVVFGLLLVSLVWQYLLPWQLADRFIQAHGRDPRPRYFYRYLLFTAISLFVASCLNILFLAQDLPSGKVDSSSNDGSLSIQNLTLGGWTALMVFAEVSKQLPYGILFLGLVNVLQSRWYTFVNATSDSKRAKRPEFLGWRRKEAGSYLVASLLIALPVISRITLAIGLNTLPNIVRGDFGDAKAGDFDQFAVVARVSLGLDGLMAAVVLVSVMDVGFSSFFLAKRLRKAGYEDSIVACVLKIITPLVGALALQGIIASSVKTLGPSPSGYSLAAVGLSSIVVGDVVMLSSLVVLSVLYAALPRWVLEGRGVGAAAAASQDSLELSTVPEP